MQGKASFSDVIMFDKVVEAEMNFLYPLSRNLKGFRFKALSSGFLFPLKKKNLATITLEALCK
jgi:hypothetical protein